MITIHLNEKNKVIIEVHKRNQRGPMHYFSYNTLVAYETADGDIFVTDASHSRTTNKHIREMLNGRECESVPQAVLEEKAG